MEKSGGTQVDGPKYWSLRAMTHMVLSTPTAKCWSLQIRQRNHLPPPYGRVPNLHRKRQAWRRVHGAGWRGAAAAQRRAAPRSIRPTTCGGDGRGRDVWGGPRSDLILREKTALFRQG